VGCDKEGSRKVQLLHRGPAYLTPVLAGVVCQFLLDRHDDHLLDQPPPAGMADSRRIMGRPLPARTCSRVPHPLPYRAQSLVDQVLILRFYRRFSCRCTSYFLISLTHLAQAQTVCHYVYIPWTVLEKDIDISPFPTFP
jgi:hypothetical protein